MGTQREGGCLPPTLLAPDHGRLTAASRTRRKGVGCGICTGGRAADTAVNPDLGPQASWAATISTAIALHVTRLVSYLSPRVLQVT